MQGATCDRGRTKTLETRNQIASMSRLGCVYVTVVSLSQHACGVGVEVGVGAQEKLQGSEVILC